MLRIASLLSSSSDEPVGYYTTITTSFFRRKRANMVKKTSKYFVCQTLERADPRVLLALRSTKGRKDGKALEFGRRDRRLHFLSLSAQVKRPLEKKVKCVYTIQKSGATKCTRQNTRRGGRENIRYTKTVLTPTGGILIAAKHFFPAVNYKQDAARRPYFS